MSLTKDQVQIGGVYVAKIGQRLCRVRIDEVVKQAATRYSQKKTWWAATNLLTGRPIKIKRANKLRLEVPPELIAKELAETPVPSQPQPPQGPFDLTATVVVDRSIEFIDITGDTFKHRKLLRSLGCDWNPRNAVWSISSNNADKLKGIVKNYDELVAVLAASGAHKLEIECPK